MTPCDHKFIDSTSCLKCGWSPDLENPLLPLIVQAHIDVEKLTADLDHLKADRDHMQAHHEEVERALQPAPIPTYYRQAHRITLLIEKLAGQEAELAIACGALAEMSRRLAEQTQAANHWFTEANAEHNRAVKAEDAYVEAHDTLARLLGHKTETTDGPQN